MIEIKTINDELKTVEVTNDAGLVTVKFDFVFWEYDESVNGLVFSDEDDKRIGFILCNMMDVRF